MSANDSNKNEIYIFLASKKRPQIFFFIFLWKEISISCVLNFNFAIAFCIINMIRFEN